MAVYGCDRSRLSADLSRVENDGQLVAERTYGSKEVRFRDRASDRFVLPLRACTYERAARCGTSQCVIVFGLTWLCTMPPRNDSATVGTPACERLAARTFANDRRFDTRELARSFEPGALQSETPTNLSKAHTDHGVQVSACACLRALGACAHAGACACAVTQMGAC